MNEPKTYKIPLNIRVTPWARVVQLQEMFRKEFVSDPDKLDLLARPVDKLNWDLYIVYQTPKPCPRIVDNYKYFIRGLHAASYYFDPLVERNVNGTQTLSSRHNNG